MMSMVMIKLLSISMLTAIALQCLGIGVRSHPRLAIPILLAVDLCAARMMVTSL